MSEHNPFTATYLREVPDHTHKATKIHKNILPIGTPYSPIGMFDEVVKPPEPEGPTSGTNGAAIPKKLIPLDIPWIAFPECTASEIDLFHSIFALNCGKRNESVNAWDIPSKTVETH